MWTIIALILAAVLGFLLCYSFLIWILFSNFEIKNERYLALFSANFGLSVTLFTFYSLDILQVDSREHRNWECTILLSLYQALLMIGLPLLFCFKFCSRWKKILIPAFFFSYWLVLFLFSNHHRSGIYVVVDFILFLLSQEKQIPCFAIIGAICSGLLSGFAAVNTIDSYWVRSTFNLGKKDYVQSLESRWLLVLEDLAETKKRIKALRAKEEGSKKQDTGIFRKILSVVSFGNTSGNLEELIRTEQGLKFMQYEIYSSLLDFYYEKKIAEYRLSVLGKFEVFFGKIASIVCIYKIILSCKNLVIGQLGSSKGVVRNVNQVIGYFFPQILEYESLPIIEQYICFLLVVIFLFTNVNSILRNMLTIYKRLMKNHSKTFTVGTLLVTASYLTASYFLTSVLTMSSSLPPKDDSTLHQIYNSNSYILNQTWNITYLFACVLAVVFQFLSCLMKSLQFV